jgi:RHS repeat-associated protein
LAVEIIDPEQWYQNSRSEVGAVCTKSVFNNAGRVTEITTAYNSSDASTTKYTYFESSSRKEMKYSQDGSTWITISFDYYASGLLKQTTYPDNTTDQFSYNLNGALTSKTDGANRTTSYLFDADGLMRYMDADGISGYEREYVYNERGQIDEIKLDGATQINYTFNVYGRVSSVTDKSVFTQNGKTVNYTYYGGGLRKEMTTPDYKLKYEYDKAMRFKQLFREISSVYKKLAEYVYNSLGQRTEYTRYWWNSQTSQNVLIVHTEYKYLANVGWLKFLENRKQVANPGTNVISSFQYYDSTAGDGHNCVGNRLFIEFANGDYMVYTYDKRYQILTETRKNNSNQELYSYTWTYDDAGNRLTQNKTVSGSQDSFVDYNPSTDPINAMNQLMCEKKYNQQGGNPLAQTDYGYDNAGNMTDKDVDSNADQTIDEYWDYLYNYENQQTEVKKDSLTVGSYAHSVVGNRVQKTASSVTTKMYYDGADCVGDYDCTSTRWYVTPGLDENLMINNGSDYFLTQDGLGSVRELVDTSQATQNSYDYEAFGSFYGTPTENVVNRYTYTGREWDSESSTYYYRARYYLPNIGCFSTKDPVENINCYAYVANYPVGLTDPMGLQSKPCCCCCVIGTRIRNIKQDYIKPEDTNQRGSEFRVSIILKFIRDKTSPTEMCTIKWGERMNYWPGWYKVAWRIYQKKLVKAGNRARQLDFAITVYSAPGCPCEYKSMTVFASQLLGVGGKSVPGEVRFRKGGVRGPWPKWLKFGD